MCSRHTVWSWITGSLFSGGYWKWLGTSCKRTWTAPCKMVCYRFVKGHVMFLMCVIECVRVLGNVGVESTEVCLYIGEKNSCCYPNTTALLDDSVYIEHQLHTSLYSNE